jgi:hypothetical protein
MISELRSAHWPFTETSAKGTVTVAGRSQPGIAICAELEAGATSRSAGRTRRKDFRMTHLRTRADKETMHLVRAKGSPA